MKTQEILRQPALVICLLYTNQGRALRVIDIAKSLKLWHGNAAKILKRLEKEGLILKINQGRIVKITLTNKGQELGKLIYPIKQALERYSV